MKHDSFTTIIKTISAALFTTLLMLFMTPTASACLDLTCELKQITDSLNDQKPLHQFTQEKSIKVLAKPLKSSGYLLLTDRKAVVWQTLKPIKSTTVISDSKLKQFNKNDQSISMPASADLQTSQLISSTFLAILSGNLDSLNENFEVESSCNDSSWEISLTPTHPRIQRLIKKIHISGFQQIQQLNFTEANDDVTRISFSSSDNKTLEQQLGQYLVD